MSISIYISLLYIVLLILGIAGEINRLYNPVGYLSLITLITAPLAIYGSLTGSFCALFGYFIIASYQLYGLGIYVWLGIGSGDLIWTKGTESLHQIMIASYLLLLLLSILLVTCKIISNVGQIETGKVIVVDNNPID